MMPQVRQAEQSASSPANGTTEYFFMQVYVHALVWGTSLPGCTHFYHFYASMHVCYLVCIKGHPAVFCEGLCAACMCVCVCVFVC